MYTDEIIKDVGGMSAFQIMIMVFVLGVRLLLGWGMLLMSFAGASPQWSCAPSDSQNVSLHLTNGTSGVCPSADNNCSLVFDQEKLTIVSEWDLVCEASTTPAFVTSIQMVGVLVGAFLGGQSADTIGRKPTYYVSIVLEGCFNLVAAFSISWQMFAVLRFFIGMTIGSLIVVSFPYSMEFVTPYWRPICSAIPFFPLGVCVMALSSWLRPDWAHQHIILAAIHVPFLFGCFIVPESMRWLAVKGRLDEAEKVVEQMCRFNKRDKPANIRMLLNKVSEEEQKQRQSGRKYTYLDIYKGWSICWKSIVIQLTWICLSLVYYGISFGVGKLSGNLYLNIFLLTVVEVPGLIASFFISNKIGRRWTAFVFFSLAALGSFGVSIVTRVASEDEKGIIINGLAFVAKLGVGAAWATIEILTSEVYPTVIRNLGNGAANTVTRVGGIIAPYIFIVEGDDVMIPFIIVGSAMTACAVMSLILRETKGIPLPDSTGVQNGGDGKLPNIVFNTKL